MTNIPTITRGRPLFVFDGHCALCSRGAAFIMRHDRKGAVQFASAQSEFGAAIYRKLGMPVDESYLLIDQDGCHTKSEGYFQLARILDGWWRLGLIGALVPRPFRDWAYDQIARNRYNWFGRVDECALLGIDERNRLANADAEVQAQLDCN